MAAQSLNPQITEKIRLPILTAGGIDFLVSGPVNPQTGKAEFLATRISPGAFTPKVIHDLNMAIKAHYGREFDLYIIKPSSVLN